MELYIPVDYRYLKDVFFGDEESAWCGRVVVRVPGTIRYFHLPDRDRPIKTASIGAFVRLKRRRSKERQDE